MRERCGRCRLGFPKRDWSTTCPDCGFSFRGHVAMRNGAKFKSNEFSGYINLSDPKPVYRGW